MFPYVLLLPFMVKGHTTPPGQYKKDNRQLIGDSICCVKECLDGWHCELQKAVLCPLLGSCNPQPTCVRNCDLLTEQWVPCSGCKLEKFCDKARSCITGGYCICAWGRTRSASGDCVLFCSLDGTIG